MSEKLKKEPVLRGATRISLLQPRQLPSVPRSDLMDSNMLSGENFVTVVRYMSVTVGKLFLMSRSFR